MTHPQTITIEERAARRRPGLGTVLQRGIHAVLGATPMPAATRTAIKSCGGCAKRAARLNKAVPRVPFL